MAQPDPTVTRLHAEIESLRARIRQLEAAETQRQQITEVLQTSPELLRQIAESLPIVLVCAEANTNRILLMIGAVKEIFGYDVEAFLAEPELGPRIIHPDDAARVYEAYRDGLAAGHPFEIEFRVFRGGTGEVVWIYQRVVPVFKPDGSLACQNCFILDISQRKRAELALRESEARFRMLSESALTGVYIIREEGFLYLNPAGAQIFGYDRDEVVGRLRPLDLVYEEDRAEIEQRIRRRLSGDQEISHNVFRGRRKDGSIVFCESIGRRIDYQGEPAIMGTMVDVTERKRREQELRFQAMVLDQIRDLITVTDLEGRILYVNEAQARALRMPRSEIIGRKTAIFGEEPVRGPRQDEILLATLEKGEWRGEIVNKRADGSEMVVDCRTWVIRDERGEPTALCGVATDVTERSRLQAQLLQSQKLQSIGTLAAGVAHDFGNLLAVVIGNISIALRHESLPAKLKDLLQDVMDAAERASGLTRQLLAYARGGFQKPSPTRLGCHVESVLQIIRRTAPRAITFVVKVPADLPQIIADPTQMEQVVMNLCLNAVEASRPPSTIEISAESQRLGPEDAAKLDLAPGEYVRLVVRDHGCGMDAATAERVFEPFFTTKPAGRGMGLAATQGIVHRHKGQIHLESTPGKGTTVSVWLPVAPWETLEKSPQTRTQAEELPHGNETILVIDALDSAARAAQGSLASLGYCTVSHASLTSALTFLDTNSEDVDLVLLATNVAHSKRTDPIQEIRARCPEVPVLVAGRSPDDASARRLLRGGAAGFVRKPFAISALSQAVRAALDQSSRPRHGDKKR